MNARLVVCPQKVRSAALYMDIAPMMMEDLRAVCIGGGLGRPLHPHFLGVHRNGQEREE